MRVPRRRAVCWQLGDGVAHRPRVTSCCLKSLGEIQFLDATRSSRFLSFFSFPPYSRQLFCSPHLNDPCPLSSSPFVPIIRNISKISICHRAVFYATGSAGGGGERPYPVQVLPHRLSFPRYLDNQAFFNLQVILQRKKKVAKFSDNSQQIDI